RRLLQFPEIFAQTGNCSGRVEDDLGSVQTQSSSPLREMPIVANVDTDIRKLRFEYGITEVPRLEVKLLPETGRAMRDMMLPVLAEVLSVRIDNGGRVVVHTFDLFFVDGNDECHRVFSRNFTHQLDGRAIRNLLDHSIPPGGLLGAKVWTGE